MMFCLQKTGVLIETLTLGVHRETELHRTRLYIVTNTATVEKGGSRFALSTETGVTLCSTTVSGGEFITRVSKGLNRTIDVALNVLRLITAVVVTGPLEVGIFWMTAEFPLCHKVAENILSISCSLVSYLDRREFSTTEFFIVALHQRREKRGRLTGREIR